MAFFLFYELTRWKADYRLYIAQREIWFEGFMGNVVWLQAALMSVLDWNHNIKRLQVIFMEDFDILYQRVLALLAGGRYIYFVLNVKDFL